MVAIRSRMTPPSRISGNIDATRTSAIVAINADQVDSALRAFDGSSAATTLPTKGSASSKASDMAAKFNGALRCGRGASGL